MDRKTRKAIMENLAVSVDVTAKALDIGKFSAYVGIKNGEIPSIRVGRKIKVPTAALRKMLGIEGTAHTT